jgi:hypothetical protein
VTSIFAVIVQATEKVLKVISRKFIAKIYEPHLGGLALGLRCGSVYRHCEGGNWKEGRALKGVETPWKAAMAYMIGQVRREGWKEGIATWLC